MNTQIVFEVEDILLIEGVSEYFKINAQKIADKLKFCETHEVPNEMYHKYIVMGYKLVNEFNERSNK